MSLVALVKHFDDVIFQDAYKKMVNKNDKRIIKYINGEMKRNSFNVYYDKVLNNQSDFVIFFHDVIVRMCLYVLFLF